MGRSKETGKEKDGVHLQGENVRRCDQGLRREIIAVLSSAVTFMTRKEQHGFNQEISHSPLLFSFLNTRDSMWLTLMKDWSMITILTQQHDLLWNIPCLDLKLDLFVLLWQGKDIQDYRDSKGFSKNQSDKMCEQWSACLLLLKCCQEAKDKLDSVSSSQRNSLGENEGKRLNISLSREAVFNLYSIFIMNLTVNPISDSFSSPILSCVWHLIFSTEATIEFFSPEKDFFRLPKRSNNHEKMMMTAGEMMSHERRFRQKRKRRLLFTQVSKLQVHYSPFIASLSLFLSPLKCHEWSLTMCLYFVTD